MSKTLEPPVSGAELPIRAYHHAVAKTLTATQELAACLRATPSQETALTFLDELIATHDTVTGQEPQWQIAIKRAWARVRAKLATAHQLGMNPLAHRAHAKAAGHSYEWGQTHSTSGHMCALDLATIMVRDDRANTSLRHSGFKVYVHKDRLQELRSDITDEHERALLLAQVAPDTNVDDPAGETEPSRPKASFSLSGKTYYVEFEGASVHLPKTRGLSHIRQLVMNPNKPIHSWTLHTGDLPPGQVYEEQVDAAGLRSYEHAIAELEQRREESDSIEERVELEEQAAKLKSHHHAATRAGMGGRKAREAASEVERMRTRVGQAIKRALDALKEECPPLYQHLKKHIIGPSSTVPSYSCPQDELPIWAL